MSSRRRRKKGRRTKKRPVAEVSASTEVRKESGHQEAGPAPESLPERRRPAVEAGAATFKRIGEEVLSAELDPAAWAQALAECRGTRDDALALYARIRSEDIKRTESERKGKVVELETRRMGSFRDFSSVPVFHKPQPYEAGLPGIVDSVFWHVLAGVGMTGCFLAARILWPGALRATPDHILYLAVVFMQLIPLVAWWSSRGTRRAPTYSSTTQMTACVSLVGSVILCVQLLAKTDRHLAAQPVRIHLSSARVLEGSSAPVAQGWPRPSDPGMPVLVSTWKEDQTEADADQEGVLVAEREPDAGQGSR